MQHRGLVKYQYPADVDIEKQSGLIWVYQKIGQSISHVLLASKNKNNSLYCSYIIYRGQIFYQSAEASKKGWLNKY